ncbi:hypothetical protein WJX73_001545 [Symbiochloris irregularis]|uniref:Uncharacterized protein n=1 Tax=Symbiochloris irregularis TaxID=706552 RepID=A0AAW1NWT7_9CHLO
MMTAEVDPARPQDTSKPVELLPPTQGSTPMPAQQRVSAARPKPLAVSFQDMVKYVLPREPGDTRDCLLMSASTAVFVLLAMQLFRVYVYLYYAAGLRPLIDVLHPRGAGSSPLSKRSGLDLHGWLCGLEITGAKRPGSPMLPTGVCRHLWLLVSILPYLRLGSADCYAAPIPIAAGQYNFFFEAGYTPPAGCPLANITISRLYAEGACVKTRDTNFGNSPPDCSSHGGTVTSSTSCASIFANGPSSAFVNLADVNRGDWFDWGNICTNSGQGFYYVQSTCTNLTSRALTFAMDPYSANWCWGNGISRGAAVGIAIAFFVLVFLFIIGIWYYVRRRQLQQRPAASNIGMQPYPQAPPPPYPGPPADTQYPSSSSGFVQPPFTPFDNKPVTGIPVPNYQSPPRV